mgnify:CR=1 FL=1
MKEELVSSGFEINERGGEDERNAYTLALNWEPRDDLRFQFDAFHSTFDSNKWDLTFYGNYAKPISLFSERHQEDLKEVYQKKSSNVQPLPFGIGYQYAKGTSNLMKATKK